jgi:hypothetical protein
MSDAPWLLLFHQLPSRPPYLRVKIWRLLRDAGAVMVRNCAYVLPATPESREAFGKIRRDIEHGRGQAVLASAHFVEGLADGEIRALFNKARNADYAALEKQLRVLAQTGKRKPSRGDDIRARLERLGQRLAHIRALDFFQASGHQAVEALLSRLEHDPIVTGTPPGAPSERKAVRRRTWVTRRNIHVDRIACAWLIGRFIDPEAVFKFTAGKRYRPLPGELRFDMADAEFTHEGDKCSFEVLLERLGPSDAALHAIGEIIHDLDIRDGKFGRPESAAVAEAIDDICRTQPGDSGRIGRGGVLFDGLYEELGAGKTA